VTYVDLLHAHEHRGAGAGHGRTGIDVGRVVAHDHGAIAYVQLRTVIAGLPADGEAKRAAQPVDGSFDIVVDKFGDDRA
jgi:hypothetical protein